MRGWERAKWLWARLGDAFLIKEIWLLIIGPTAGSAVLAALGVRLFTPLSAIDTAMVALACGTAVALVASLIAIRRGVVHHHSATVHLAGVAATAAVAPVAPLTSPRDPQIEIIFEKRAPYETTEISHNNTLSTVRIGIRNSGGGALSNCKVLIEAAVPAPPIPGGFPLRLDGEGFIVRHDDPEKLIDVATHWANGPAKLRFNTPISGNFSDSLMYIDDSQLRTIVITIVASECRRSASFQLWTDKTKALHLEFLSYTS